MLKPKIINVDAIDHIVIRANDLDRMTAFYRDVLGCEVERESAEYRLVQLRAGNALIDLMGVGNPDDSKASDTERPTSPNMDHFCVRISPWNEKALQNHLTEHGVSFGKIGERYGANGKVPALYLTDPEGNMVELMGAPDN